MGPSQSQLRLLSPEDRIVYKQWLRRSLLFYASAMALLILAALANHVFTAPPSDVAGDTMRTAAISARK
jgi:hypothetical protein